MTQPTTLYAILYGQLLAILMACATVFSGQMEHAGFPTFQVFPVYLILSFGLIIHAIQTRKTHPKVQHDRDPSASYRSLWVFILMALLDVEGNFLIVTAIQSAALSMTTAQTLNSATVPFSVILSLVFLKRRFSLKSILAISCTVIGLGLVVYCSSKCTPLTSGTPTLTALIASLITLTASLCYASCNVIEEITAKADPPVRMLGLFGACGCVISVVQGIALESHQVSLITSAMVWPWLGFCLSMSTFYVGLVAFLARFDATLFNLSILTAGMYVAVLESILNWSWAIPSCLYGVGFALVIFGSAAYHRLQKV